MSRTMDAREAAALAAVRGEIEAADRELLTLAAQRLELARREGELRRAAGGVGIDFAYERVVLEAARNLGEALGLGAEVAEDLVARLVRASVTAQEEDSLRHAATGAGDRAVVVGGRGRMGRWMCRFLEAQGFDVAILDPALPADRERAEAWLPTAQLVICAAPPRPAAEIYETWCSAPPSGVIADLASIKSPLLPALRRLQEAGGRVASFHPMFGPDKALLRDADVLLCTTGDDEAEEMVESLFRPTTARLVRVPVEQHDRLMADLLSLAHAAAIAFAVALPASDHPVRSTTFQALEDLAARVVLESPDVYYEIQALNPHSVRAVEKLQAALDTLLDMVRKGNVEGFRQLMELGRRRTTNVACHWAGES